MLAVLRPRYIFKILQSRIRLYSIFVIYIKLAIGNTEKRDCHKFVNLPSFAFSIFTDANGWIVSPSFYGAMLLANDSVRLSQGPSARGRCEGFDYCTMSHPKFLGNISKKHSGFAHLHDIWNICKRNLGFYDYPANISRVAGLVKPFISRYVSPCFDVHKLNISQQRVSNYA